MSISGTWQTTAPSKFGMLRHHGGDQKPAIRAAHDAELLGRGEAARFEIGGHRREIVEGALAVFLQRRVVPGRTELAAAADVGDAHRRRPWSATAGRNCAE